MQVELNNTAIPYPNVKLKAISKKNCVLFWSQALPDICDRAVKFSPHSVVCYITSVYLVLYSLLVVENGRGWDDFEGKNGPSQQQDKQCKCHMTRTMTLSHDSCSVT